VNCGELERRRGEVDGLEARRLGEVAADGEDAEEEAEADGFGAKDENAKLSLPVDDPSTFVEVDPE
jgi:hypothetical protein